MGGFVVATAFFTVFVLDKPTLTTTVTAPVTSSIAITEAPSLNEVIDSWMVDGEPERTLVIKRRTLYGFEKGDNYLCRAEDSNGDSQHSEVGWGLRASLACEKAIKKMGTTPPTK